MWSGHVAASVTNPVEVPGTNIGNGLVLISFTPKPATPPTGPVTCQSLTGTATYKPALSTTPSADGSRSAPR